MSDMHPQFEIPTMDMPFALRDVPIKVAPAPLQLFDLQNDPGEQNDVSAAHPEIVAHLRRLHAELTRDAPVRPAPPPKQKSAKL